MKEVKKLISVLITNEFKGVSFISPSYYRSNAISFHSNISSSNILNHIESLVDKHQLTKEISKLQSELYAKQVELVKILSESNKKDAQEDLVNDGTEIERCYWRSDNDPETKYFDEYKAIRSGIASIRSIRFNRLETRVKEFAGKINQYINETEAKVFEAYSKGMSADDFLEIVREEIKEFQNEKVNITKELEANGYKHDNN